MRDNNRRTIEEDVTHEDGQGQEQGHGHPHRWPAILVMLLAVFMELLLPYCHGRSASRSGRPWPRHCSCRASGGAR
ncbi:hypothetical protein [Streptomyces iconiensis]|uniref:Uncharacterized protein n=1 Tax=Streptomyces iconiensis TaxID=1384038 RepID=A0ABT6ZQE6_9ACTN|nr:hypothetical protein [Streptomyces iconiensis]MDJ1131280.1 hypothetical protein [Streptomyces iconiensis]